MGISIGGELLVILLSLLAFVMTLNKLLGLVTGAVALLSCKYGVLRGPLYKKDFIMGAIMKLVIEIVTMMIGKMIRQMMITM